MIVRNADRGTALGGAIEVAGSGAKRVKGLLGCDRLDDGQGLLLPDCSSIHTFFMHFAIDILFMDKEGKVLKAAPDVKPFKLVAAPFRAHYALELPAGVIGRSSTRVGDHLLLLDDGGPAEDAESPESLSGRQVTTPK